MNCVIDRAVGLSGVLAVDLGGVVRALLGVKTVDEFALHQVGVQRTRFSLARGLIEAFGGLDRAVELGVGFADVHLRGHGAGAFTRQPSIAAPRSIVVDPLLLQRWI